MIERCYTCDRPATHYCDGSFAWPAHDDDITRRIYGARRIINVEAADEGAGACDRPLCLHHATQVGHTCGAGGCDTIDLCPDCYVKSSSNEPPLILTMAELQQARAAREHGQQ